MVQFRWTAFTGTLAEMSVPKRVVSLVPSLTELVWELGAQDRLVGRTRFCTEPPELTGFVPAFGGTKDPDIPSIAALQPDLVIANKEENRKEDIEALRARGIRVVVTDPCTVRQAMDMVLQIGLLLGCEQAAREIHQATATALQTNIDRPLRIFVPIWRKPLMAMGGDCYGSDVLLQAGGQNVFADRARYPEVSKEEIAAARPDRILLPDEPYHFTEAHLAEFEDIAPTSLISGQLLWWYGPRMATALQELRTILHPGVGA